MPLLLSDVDPTTPGGVCSNDGCEVKTSSLWYGKKGSKQCKRCYDNGKKNAGDILEASHPKRPRLDDSASPSILTVDAFGADFYISEVFGIKDERCSTQRLRRFWGF